MDCSQLAPKAGTVLSRWGLHILHSDDHLVEAVEALQPGEQPGHRLRLLAYAL